MQKLTTVSPRKCGSARANGAKSSISGMNAEQGTIFQKVGEQRSAQREAVCIGLTLGSYPGFGYAAWSHLREPP